MSYLVRNPEDRFSRDVAHMFVPTSVTHLTCFSVLQCQLVDLVYFMSGDVRRDFKSSVTHLVANTIGGERYDVS